MRFRKLAQYMHNDKHQSKHPRSWDFRGVAMARPFNRQVRKGESAQPRTDGTTPRAFRIQTEIVAFAFRTPWGEGVVRGACLAFTNGAALALRHLFLFICKHLVAN